MVTFLLDESKSVYSAYEDNIKIGECTFSLRGYDMLITSLECEDETVSEGLLRSSMNFCAQNGAYLSHITENLLRPAAEKLGFSSHNCIVEIPEALMSCGCHHN